MRNKLLNILKIKQSTTRPIGNRYQAQRHILYVNKSISVCTLLKSAIALFVIKTAKTKTIKIL